MGQKNVCILHHQCEKIKFLGRKMNFVVATPKHVTLQIQRQVTDLDHAEIHVAPTPGRRRTSCTRA